jgi:hypothetical protein
MKAKGATTVEEFIQKHGGIHQAFDELNCTLSQEMDSYEDHHTGHSYSCYGFAKDVLSRLTKLPVGIQGVKVSHVTGKPREQGNHGGAKPVEVG